MFGFWAAEQAGQFIGWFSLRQIEGLPEQATLGYRLSRSSWGQGLATEGSRLLIERGFRMGNLQQIIATTYEDNLASIAVMTKLGMRFERRYRLGADELAGIDTAAADPADAFPGDDVEYAIRRSDWLKERA